MIIFGNQKADLGAAKVDKDIIAFDVRPDEVEAIVQYLTQMISHRAMMEFGMPAQEIE